MDIMAERLDIATLISSEGYLNALSNVLMEPYQMKIISYFKKKKDDGTKLAYSIPIGEAVNVLKRRTQELDYGSMETKVNRYLNQIVYAEDKDIFKEKMKQIAENQIAVNKEVRRKRREGNFVMSSEVSPEKRNINQRLTPAPRRHIKQK